MEEPGEEIALLHYPEARNVNQQGTSTSKDRHPEGDPHG
jgi:hypothetical protein